MINFRKKLLLSAFFAMIVTTICMGSALAGVSISGNTKVYPGRTYTYTVTVTENASSIMGTASTGGVLGSQSKTWNKDSPTGFNSTISASCTFTVKIPASATIGSTGTISVSGQGSSYPDASSSVTKFNISGSKTITVVTPPTPPPPTAWELAVKDIKKVDEGGSITIEMNPEKEKELKMPIEALQAIKERNITLTVDFTTFKCILSGSDVGEVPNGLEDINLGYTMLPADRAEDMIVFTPNHTETFRFAMTYVLPPNLPIPDDLIYVYRRYPVNNVMEFVETAKADADGNVEVYVFTPGEYIVSAKSIDGTIGNLDAQTMIEMFATPTPAPTPTPTVAPTPSPSPTPAPVVEEPKTVPMSTWLIGILAVLLVAMGAAVFVMMRKGESNLPANTEK